CAVTERRDIGRVSAVGTGLLSRPGLTALALSALSEAGIAADCVLCSQTRSSFLVPRDRVHDAVRVLHERFCLDRSDTDAAASAVPA
ncbi:ACT domain-containing protein, partial [Saccharothrix coeruleofusca]